MAARVSLANKKGEKSASLGKHKVGKIPISRIKEGMWVRDSWNPHMPFMRTSTDSSLDPNHPDHYDPGENSGEDPQHHYVVNYRGGRIDPHQPENSTYHVLFRDRRK